MAAPGKQYGLIFPKKLLQRNAFAPKHSAFADDSDDETSVGKSLQKEALKKSVMKQTKLEMQRALEEDASVYEYDNVYDDMQKEKEENTAKLLSGQDRKPKYIQNILKAVEVRKKEQEKRMEKKIQKEREMEGEEFKDKEAFLTTAYKKKLQEKADEEERERREAELEASLDVTKQKDLSGFYRHLLNQTVGEEKAPECSLRDAGVKEEKPRGYPDEEVNSNQEKNIDADSDLGTESSEEEEFADIKPPSKSDNLKKSAKTYRKQRHSSSSSEEQDNHKEQDRDKNEAGNKAHNDKNRHRKREDSDCELRATEVREHKSSKDGKRGDDGHRKEVEYYNEKERDEGKKHKDRMDDERGRDRNVKEYRHKEYGDKSERDFKDRSERQYEHKMDRERGEKIEGDYERRADRDRSERANKYRFYSERNERSERDRGERFERDRGERSERDRGERSERDRGERSERDRGERSERDRGERSERNRGERSERDRRERPDKEHRERLDLEDMEYKDKKHSDSNKKRSSSPFEMPPKNESKSDVAEAQSVNKFAKRSNEETLVSARDRYLARQITRVKTKAYVEKEED